jgi:hypothetical protein
MSKNYALVNENNEVVNVTVFADDATPEHFAEIAHVNNAVACYSFEEYGTTSIGGSFDGTKLWFPQPFTSWVKDEETCTWQAPILKPDDGKIYIWNEELLNWEEISE